MAVETALIPEDIRLRLKSYINSRTGLYFKDYDLKDLDKVITARIKDRGLDSPYAYYTYITSSDGKEDELRELLNRITIKHTYFFRNEPQFNVLRKVILPQLMEKKLKEARGAGLEKPVLRVWSAGCSTGEEPYTIAMIIRDSVPDLEKWDIQIIATDASQEALSRAAKGIYGISSMRLVDMEHKELYFTEKKKTGQDERYEINDDIKRMVTFGYHNLIDEDYPSGFDMIFCRNVVIYFELGTTVKVMTKIRDSLNDNGYLFIGYSESLYFLPGKFKMISRDEAIYYRKAGHAEAPKEESAPAGTVETSLEEALEEISKKELEAELEKMKATVKAPAKDFKEILIQAIKCAHMKEYTRAMAFLEEASLLERNAIDPYYLAAEVYVNQGRFREAKAKLSYALQIDPLFAPAHYLLGCINMEEGDIDKAKENLKKSLYIDKDMALAHFYMAQAYKNEGKAEASIREYRNTMKGLSASKPDDILAYGGGFNVSTLMSVCRDNIERLKLEPV